MRKMNIDQAFEVVCKRLDDYDTFLLMVQKMREAQKDFDALPCDCAEVERFGKKAELIENAVDKWLEDNI